MSFLLTKKNSTWAVLILKLLFLRFKKIRTGFKSTLNRRRQCYGMIDIESHGKIETFLSGPMNSDKYIKLIVDQFCKQSVLLTLITFFNKTMLQSMPRNLPNNFISQKRIKILEWPNLT